MREIKFRAWSPYLNRMVQPNDVTDPYTVECIPTGTGFELYSKKASKNILMQYTGLQDKNGVDIYEGDIAVNRLRTGQVFYEDDTACWYIGEPSGNSDALYLEDLEVIGNIYENPELLK